LLSRLNPPGAITPLETALSADPGRIDARNILGLAFAATGRVNDAIHQYDIVLAADPGVGRARFNRANALMKAGRTGNAIHHYRAAMAAFPDYACQSHASTTRSRRLRGLPLTHSKWQH
jgi:Tfp pilus assembly protein PilF